MKEIVIRCFLGLAMLLTGGVFAQAPVEDVVPEKVAQEAPADVVASAVNAVEELGRKW